MFMFLTIQARSQPDVCTEHKQCYLASNISAKISFFLIRKISSILEELYMGRLTLHIMLRPLPSARIAYAAATPCNISHDPVVH